MLENLENIFIIQPVSDGFTEMLHDEAISLIYSANAVYVGSAHQKIREINPSTYIGKGKLEEIKQIITECKTDTVLFNGELSPSQTLNISAHLNDIKVIDKTTLILDIFAQRAKSAEGKLQVELAQLKYIYPRLKGRGIELSRLGGGIGTRGPGETKLETDRRHIKRRIRLLEKQLTELSYRRTNLTERRKKTNTKTVALVGYTNAGKSSLLTALTGEETFIEDKLFATLDTLSRTLKLKSCEVLLTDTVGFINNLPHDIVDAFKSTLESAKYSDLNLIVCDASADYKAQLETTLSTLNDIGSTVPYLLVMNKCDLVKNYSGFPKEAILVSALEKKGLENLLNEIDKHFSDQFRICTLKVPYSNINTYMALKKDLTENRVEFTDEQIIIEAIIPQKFLSKFSLFLVE